MKELKLSVANEIKKGFSEVNKLLNVYANHLDSISLKSKEEELEQQIFDEMETLKSVCYSHLTKIQNDLFTNIINWKKKKGE